MKCAKWRQEEFKQAKKDTESLEGELQILLLPKRSQTMIIVASLRSEPVLAVMKPQFLPETFSECIAATQSNKAGA